MEKKRICNNFSINYQYSRKSPFFLVSVFEWTTGLYVSSLMSNDKESLIKQLVEYAQLNGQEEIQLRKIII